jgi:hypothetical protein
VTGDALSPAEIAVIERTPSLVLGGGDLFARQVFGATAPRADSAAARSGSSNRSGRPPSRHRPLHGKREMRLPAVPFCEASELTKGTVLATHDGRAPVRTPRPAIARRNRCIWSLLDLGTAFANLMNEDDGVVAQAPPTLALVRDGAKAAELVYYAAPDALRGWVQRRTYATLDQRLAALGDRASSTRSTRPATSSSSS